MFHSAYWLTFRKTYSIHMLRCGMCLILVGGSVGVVSEVAGLASKSGKVARKVAGLASKSGKVARKVAGLASKVWKRKKSCRTRK
ncbi:hypothetical protein BACSP_01207 [Bacillus sp. T2.9-1]|nr:hypothetical protein BACSP_01207 [Bacillus sp. T2.9-1]